MECNWILGDQEDLNQTVRCFHLVMREHNAQEKGPWGYVAQTALPLLRQANSSYTKRQGSPLWLEIWVVFSAQGLALVKARDKMLTPLLAIKTSLWLFPGMEALAFTLLHAASFQVMVATCKLHLGMLRHLCCLSDCLGMCRPDFRGVTPASLTSSVGENLTRMLHRSPGARAPAKGSTSKTQGLAFNSCRSFRRTFAGKCLSI